MLDKVLKIASLIDFYGALLTDKQRRCLELHYLEDWSLAEIAGEFEVSRQAVHDILRRSEQLLVSYEERLGLIERYARIEASIKELDECVSTLDEWPQKEKIVRKIRSLMNDFKEG
ncbi:MAG: YlxM family DNA-binding protein [Selenomonadales bacterium]|nr:YlxM family DNA-binding protein [Selenomonadales bacterium]